MYHFTKIQTFFIQDVKNQRNGLNVSFQKVPTPKSNRRVSKYYRATLKYDQTVT